jgi:hypothetical protein
METNIDDCCNHYELDWTKKQTKAIFRGGVTGCGRTSDTNMRIRLAKMKSDLLDVGIVSQYDPVKVYSLKFDPKDGLGHTFTDIPSSDRVPYDEQSTYKYVIHIDGNVAAYRLLSTMLFGSVILRVKSGYTLWCDTMLKPYVHYVPVKSDLSDLNEIVNWCIENDSKCKEIARSGREIARTMLRRDYIEKVFSSLFFTLSK